MKHNLRIIFLLLIANSSGFAIASKLNFSDIITGPSTGLGDTKGVGAIVTIWGQYRLQG